MRPSGGKASNGIVNRAENRAAPNKRNTGAEIEKIAHQMDGLYDAIPDGLRTQGLETKPEVLE